MAKFVLLDIVAFAFVLFLLWVFVKSFISLTKPEDKKEVKEKSEKDG